MKSLLKIVLCAAMFNVVVIAQDGKTAVKPVKPVTPVTPVTPAVKPAPRPSDSWSEDKSISYMYGSTIGRQLGDPRTPFNIDFKAFIEGLQDAFNKKDLQITEQRMQQISMAFQQKMQAKANDQQKLQAKAAEKGIGALKKGIAYLAANKKKEGVKETASGLQYRVITEGKGAKPTATDKVKVHYKGTLIDGTEFDSSYKRNKPFEASLAGGVIPGWLEGMKLMAVGSKFEFTIPHNLAYGERGQGSIGPNEVLVFEIEMISIVK